jgi:hypothetical protein
MELLPDLKQRMSLVSVCEFLTRSAYITLINMFHIWKYSANTNEIRCWDCALNIVSESYYLARIDSEQYPSYMKPRTL